MKNNDIQLNQNELVQYLKKPAKEFTREDIIKFIEAKGITMVNFRYVADDGKLKSLNFVPFSRDHLESILTAGERVDGSSLFSFVESDASDLYVIPRYRTAFVNPFEETPTLEILCSFYNSDGKPLESAPEYILEKHILDLLKIPVLYLRLLASLNIILNLLTMIFTRLSTRKVIISQSPLRNLKISGLKPSSSAQKQDAESNMDILKLVAFQKTVKTLSSMRLNSCPLKLMKQ